MRYVTSLITLVGCLCLWSPRPAAADTWSQKFDETLDFSFHAKLGKKRLPTAPNHLYRATEPVSTSSPLSQSLRYRGAALRANLSLQGVRAGVGLGYHHLDSPFGNSSHRNEFSGATFVGYAVGRDIRPFIDLRAVWSAIPSNPNHSSVHFELGVRGGVLFALNEFFFLNLSIEHSATQSALSVGLGLPIPMSNL